MPDLPGRIWRKILAGLFSCFACVAQADDGFPAVQLHGFGTLGISCFSSREADFVYDLLPNGPGRTRRCDVGTDSLLGVQTDVQPVDALTASLQIISQRSPRSSTFRPDVQLANLRWQINDAWWLRLGRVNNPMFIESDYRLVRHALTGARTPSEVYGMSPTYQMDGLDTSYRFVVSGWRGELYGGIHTNDIKTRNSNSQAISVYSVRDIRTVTLSGERGAWTLKAGYNTDRVFYADPRTDLLFDLLRRLGASSLADNLTLNNTAVRILSASVRYDDNDWQVQSEVVRRHFEDSYFRDAWAAYLTVGRRLGLWMPHVTLARRQTSGRTVDPRAPAFLASYVSDLLTATRYDQRSLTLGVSREIGKNMSGKLQVQWIRPDKNAWGNVLTNFSPSYDPSSPLRGVLVSANLDFLF